MIFITIILFIGLAVFLAWYLLSKDKGSREPASMLWAALGFGALGVVPAVFIESLLMPGDTLETRGMAIGGILLMSLLIGFVEEVCKFLPLALFIYKKHYFNEYTDGILYFALAGLGFGLPENIMYTLMYGGSTGALRLVLMPFFHAATTAFVGYFLARAKLTGKSPLTVIWPLMAMILLHAMYDFGLMTGLALLIIVSLVITVGLTAALFAMAVIAKRRDQELGLSVVGSNTFCRTCGTPNPKHLLYCQRCGRRA